MTIENIPPEKTAPEAATEAANTDAKALVQRLVDEAKMTPQSISEALEERVSSRTVYRWLKGECTPHQPGDIKALRALVEKMIKN